jgi:hypothetical protein
MLERNADRVAPENVGAQSGQEPVSGVQGKGTATEPYDQGNASGTKISPSINMSTSLMASQKAPQGHNQPIRPQQPKAQSPSQNDRIPYSNRRKTRACLGRSALEHCPMARMHKLVETVVRVMSLRRV